MFSLAGAVLPQEGATEAKDIALWQTGHPAVSSVLGYIGFFHVFHSWPFLITLFLLALNTLTCTIGQFAPRGRFHTNINISFMVKLGFLLLHLSIVGLLAGGFYSAAARLSGRVLLTEGQTFTEEHDSYLLLAEGPFRGEQHKGFAAKLKQVKIQYEKQLYPVDITSEIEIYSGKNKITDGIIKVNFPFTYDGVSFTYEDDGFSPRLLIRDKNTGAILANPFVALKTFRQDNEIRYHDFLPFPFFEHVVTITFYPSFVRQDGKIIKTSEEVKNPLVLVEMTDESGKILASLELPLGEKGSLGKYDFTFTDIRRWTALKIVNDPGYPIVCVSLWLSMVALCIRYFPEILKWFKTDK
jgi:cytochrome c biogenesis protein ResB